MAKIIKIGDKTVGNNYTPFIIAEAGINHNGNIDNAYEMIKVAKNAGADCIKFQTFKAEEFVSDPNQTYTYKSCGINVTESMLDMFKRCEFSKNEWKLIKKKCEDEGIIFLSTPQNRTDLDLLLDIGVSAIKVGSDDFVNLPLIKDYSLTGLPIILSCGMANLAEVYETLETIGFYRGYPVALLLCTSQYPTEHNNANLLKLKTLASAFPEIILGFSDHTVGSIAASVAVPLGASLFEKHFTLDNNLKGPDHWFSANPDELKNWVKSIRTAHILLGSEEVRATPAEEDMKKVARRSIVTARDISAGEELTLDNICLKRPGTGLPPKMIQEVLGRVASKNIQKDSLILFGDFR